ncbi:CRE-PAX-3 protein [Caenorhabditis remanei]|uniref:CRE-PAX-3 protein n=2 Tax=Caenorhabditis TaxID=6237 RepID=E3NE64_CAERE|nr:CRE-PAX-3 protein [Caenorhabditis remanei]
MTTDSITFNHILGQGRVNQLGGVFINGRPLPIQVRHAIITMAKKGVKPCHISRQLKVSHGAVSKILNRYQETGSISPGQIGGSPRARLTVQAVEKEIIIAYEENPHLSPAELRDLLIQKEICTKGNAPTVPAIKRLIGSKGLGGGVIPQTKKMERKRLSYSIDSILGISIDECSKSSSDDEGDSSSTSPTTTNDSSSAARRNRTSFSAEQLDILETSFRASTYPDGPARENISKETGLSEDKIMTWFSNRRARCRKNMPIYHQYNVHQGFAAATQTVSGRGVFDIDILFNYLNIQKMSLESDFPKTRGQDNPLFFQHVLHSSPSSTHSSPPSS